MTSNNQSIPQSPIENVLLKSRRRCAFCFESGDFQPKEGNIAHIRPVSKGETDTPDNLVFLCKKHFVELESQKEAKEIQQDWIKNVRSKLYQAVEYESTSGPSSKPYVFVVHGQDFLSRATVAQFLERIGLQPIILSEKPSFGYSILEQIDNHISDAQYAIVLLTADEQISNTQKKNKRLVNRARQNIIFELGYFLGRLGRNRVCVLYKKGVDIPADFLGTIYIELDQNKNWEKHLELELRDAGLVKHVK